MVAAAARAWRGSSSKGCPRFFSSDISTRMPCPVPSGAANKSSQKLWGVGISAPGAPAFGRPLRHESQDRAADVGADLLRRLGGIHHTAVGQPLDQREVGL